MTIDTNGGTDANGRALAELIAFLRDDYGVERLHLVAHSDGGLWSRAALTQSAAYRGVEIESLTTLGTPHTGSYLADLEVELQGGKCDFSNRTEQRICEGVGLLADAIAVELGPIATEELTNDFLATWNPKQRIGSCPVSVIAGDHVGFDVPLLEYYTPSDGLVGLASAKAQEAIDIGGGLIPAPSIPDLREAGVYDVVHGASLQLLFPKTLLNQIAISEQVAEETLLSGREPCNAATSPDEAGAAAAAPDIRGQRLRAPLYRLVAADRNGQLPQAGSEDFVVSEPRSFVRCGSRELKQVPILGDRRLRISDARGCDEPPRVRRTNGEAATAVLLRSHPKRHLIVRVGEDRLRIRVKGKAPKRLRAQVDAGSGWEQLPLDSKGRAKLPESQGESLRLRVRAKAPPAGHPPTWPT